MRLENCYIKLVVTGVNLNLLINRMQNEGICIKNLKKTHPKRIRFCLPVKHQHKFFAIVKDLCYNDFTIQKYKNPKTPVFVGGGYTIYKLGEGGLGYPIRFLTQNLGVLIGTLIFSVGVFFANDLVLDVRCVGQASWLFPQVQTILEEQGVKKWGRFSNIDLTAVGNLIVTNTPTISFAQCVKRGNVLYVELQPAKQPVTVLDQTVQKLFSDVDGVVSQIKVYRGTAAVKQGDLVKKGDLLVDGFCKIKDFITPCTVLASITLDCEYVGEVILDKDNQQDLATSLVLGQLPELSIKNIKVKKSVAESGVIYQVIVSYTHTVTAG